jgi:benzylsuccinate CoA-transferase BbsE subunit
MELTSAAPGAADSGAGFLGGVRVVDFTDAPGRYAARLLADLGAEVIRAVQPGDERIGPPPYTEVSGRRVSLFDRFVAVNTHVIVLDTTTAPGRQVLERLLTVSDLMIDTPDEQGRTAHGYGAEELAALAPRLNRLSIRAFGSDGPTSSIASDDLTVLAASGLLSLGGYHDTEPIAVAGLQSYVGRSIYGVVGALLVLLQGREDGVGRHIEVAGQEVMAGALEDTVAEYDFHGRLRGRLGGVPRGAGTGTFRCADGYVAMVAGRLGTARGWAALVRWLAEDGVPGAEVLAQPEWSEYSYRATPSSTEFFTGVFERFAATRTKEELYREGQLRKIAIAPVNSPSDTLADAQLAAREFFRDVADPELGMTLTSPGRPYRAAELDGLPYQLYPVNAAVTAAVLAEALGLDEEEIAGLRREGVIR